jgi:hypothetical protein
MLMKQALWNKRLSLATTAASNPSPILRWQSRMLAFLFSMLVSACSVKFVYNQLDWLIPWYLDNYVSLNESQQNLLESRITGFLERHRHNQLPVYADFLQKAAQDVEDGLDQDELEQMVAGVTDYINLLSTHFGVALLDVFASLDTRQVDGLMANLGRENQEFRLKFVDTDSRRQRWKRKENMVEMIQRWTGELNPKQLGLIEQWSEQYQLMGDEFIQSRLQWQQQLRQVLQHRNQPQQLEQGITRLFGDRRSTRTEQHRRKFQYNENLLKRLFLTLDRSLTSEQRYHFVRKLNNYAEDFRELSESGCVSDC